MATAKQIILPIAVLVFGVAAFFGMKALKQPPEEKPFVDTTPLVSVDAVQFAPMTFEVNSYGVVDAKYQTEMVSQVTGEIVYLSEGFVKGGFVKKDEIIAKIDPSDYESNLLDAQASLASAKASLVQESANAKVAEKEWALITDSKPTDLSLRKPQLAQEMARLKSAEAGYNRAKRDLERTIIRAPYDALIASRQIGLGSFVSKGTSIGLMLNTETAEIRLPIADKEFQFLAAKGADAKVTLSGDFAGAKQQWSAKIVRSEGVVDNKSRMTYLVAEVSDPYGLVNPSNELRFGTYVTAHITGANVNNVAIIPRHLIVNGSVATLDENKTLRYKAVNVIRQQGANVVIDSGLENGNQIVTSALDYPVEGMKLALPGDKLLQKEPVEETPESDLVAESGE